MTKLIRNIEVTDLNRVSQILEIVFSDSQYSDIRRLGGMTNRSYCIKRCDGKEYLVRIPGEGTEELINRSDEKKSTLLACELDIDSQLLYFGDDGVKVMKFVSDAQTMSEKVMCEPANIQKAAAIFNRLHTCGKDTGVAFEVFEMASAYERIIEDNQVLLYSDYAAVKHQIMQIKEENDRIINPVKVPCHNDSLIDNWVLDSTGRLYLIDWEYSGMNEPMWDLSCLSIECNYMDVQDKQLLEAYYRRRPLSEEWRNFLVSKLYVDYLWTLWGLTRVPYDGQFMQDYADYRYERLKMNLRKMSTSLR